MSDYTAHTNGASRDGSSDETAGLRATTIAARNKGRGIVYLPAGVYDVHGAILDSFAGTSFGTPDNDNRDI